MKILSSFVFIQAYARPGFATLQYELYPPLELCGNYCPEFQGDNKPSTRENLILFLKSTLNARENSYYKSGQYTVRDSPHIDHPKGLVVDGATTNADIIVTYCWMATIAPTLHVATVLTPPRYLDGNRKKMLQ